MPQQRDPVCRPPPPRTCRLVGSGNLAFFLLCVVSQPGNASFAAEFAGKPSIQERAGIAGNDSGAWIWQPASDDPAAILRLAFCETTPETAWRCSAGPGVNGRVARACAIERDVLFFFQDGTVRRFTAPRLRFDGETGGTSTIQPSLPDRALPFFVAADAVSGRVFALTAPHVATNLESARERRSVTDDDVLHFGSRQATKSGANETTSGPRESVRVFEQRLGSASFTVLRFDAGAWSFDRPAPNELQEPEQILALWAARNRPRLLFRSVDETAPAEVRHASGSDDAWFAGPPLTVPVDATRVVAAYDDAEREDVVAIAQPHGTFQRVNVWRCGTGGWRAAGTLSLRTGEAASFRDPPVLAVVGKNILTSTLDPAEPQSYRIWSAVDGVEQGPLVVQRALTAPTTPTLNPIARHTLQYAALVAVLTSVFVWRRERMTNLVILEPGQSPASFPRRGLSFLIDAMVLAPVTAPVLWTLWGPTADASISWEELLRAAEATGSPLFWTGSVFGALFGVYSTLCELAMGATVGKRICGCRVVGEGGKRCGARAILIRNAVRVVEFHFTASFLVVLLTPGRQRLGDLLARTLVVERAEVESSDSDVPPVDEDSERP